MSIRRLLAAAILAAAVPGTALSQDPARGAGLVAQSCANCHGADGRSQQQDIPSLAGQQALFITVQMILFREGLRQVPVMTAFAANLPDRDIEDMAAFFASLPHGPPTDRSERDQQLFDRGRALSARMNCRVCHLPDYRGQNQVPRINAQREEFLARTISEYRDGLRVGADPQMNGAAVGMTNADIAAVAHYLAHLD